MKYFIPQHSQIFQTVRNIYEMDSKVRFAKVGFGGMHADRMVLMMSEQVGELI